MNAREQWKLIELAERYLGGHLSAIDTTALDERLKTDVEARKLFAAVLHQHAELRVDKGLLHGLEQVSRPQTTLNGWWRSIAVGAAAAGIAFTSAWFLSPGKTDVGTVATLVQVKSCQWASSTLPTNEGARLTPGTLDLIEGMATLKFDSGAELVLEAPATLEVLDGMNCRLKRGTLVADVPPSAKGFSIDTEKAKVVDWGTRFGVSASEDGKYLVQVMEGRVDVTEKSSKKTKELLGGDRVDRGWSQSKLRPEDQGGEPEPARWQPDAIIDGGNGWRIISTAFGLGRDTYIQSHDKPSNFGEDPFMRVKRTELAANLNRKAYVAFDLGKLAGQRVLDAELILTIEPSDLGFASFVPDSTFAVYGLINEAAEGWTESGPSWQNAPAHDGKNLQPIPSESRLLGHFSIAQGVNRGTAAVKGAALASFLNSDTNGQVTFIIVRETTETQNSGLVHAFSTKENAKRPPPLLKVRVE